MRSPKNRAYNDRLARLFLHLCLALVLLSTLAQPAWSESRFRWQFHALPIANLVYQLDCLSGQGHCSVESYRQLWQNELQWSVEDQQKLVEWRKIKDAYRLQWEFNTDVPKLTFPLRFEGLDMVRKFRLPALEAREMDDYRSRIALLTRPVDADQIQAIVAHFYPRFEHWWKNQAETKTEYAANEFMQLIQARHLDQWAEKAAYFYASQMPQGALLNFHFMLRPGNSGTHNGEQIENHSLVEVLPDKPLKNQVAVVLHELNHYLYARSGNQTQAEIVKWFSDRPEVWAIPAYNLLNEVIATTLANGLLMGELLTREDYQRYLQTPGSFYADAYIDPVAKRLLPRLEIAINRKEHLNDPAFLADYLKIVKEALGEQALNPELYLRTSGFVSEGSDFQPLLRAFQTDLRIGAAWGSQNLEQGINTFRTYPALSGVVFLYPEQLPKLKSWNPLINAGEWQKMDTFAKKHPNFIWGLKSQSNAWIFCFVAQDFDQFQKLVVQFKLQKRVFSGPLL
jgi:hypothetical protein